MRPLLFALVAVSAGCVHRFPGSASVPAAAQLKAPQASSGIPPLAARVKATAHIETLQYNAALDDVARLLADDLVNGHVFAGVLYTQELLWRRGIAASAERVFGAWAHGDMRKTRLEEMVAEDVKTTKLEGRYYGVSFSSALAPSTIAMVVVDARVDLDNFKTSYAPGEALVLAGRVNVEPPTSVEMYVPGELQPRTVQLDADGRWAPIEMTAPATPGRYFVEVIDPARHRLLLAPVSVGALTPEPIDLPVPTTPEEVEAEVRARIAQWRALGKAAPLASDPGADAMARGRAQRREHEAAPTAGERSALGFGDFTSWTWERAQDRTLLELRRPSLGRDLLVAGDVLAVGVAKDPEKGWVTVVEILKRKK